MDTTPDASKTSSESESLTSWLSRVLSAPSLSKAKSSEAEDSFLPLDRESKLIASFEQEVEQFNWDTTENPDDTFSPLSRNIESGSTPVLIVETENHSSSSFDDTMKESEMNEDRRKAGAILEVAVGDVTKVRGASHGALDTSFQMIADFWNMYITHKEYARKGGLVVRPDITATDVAQMMALVKKARMVYGDAQNADHYADDAGYSAIAGALAGAVGRGVEATGRTIAEAPANNEGVVAAEEEAHEAAERMVGGYRNG